MRNTFGVIPTPAERDGMGTVRTIAGFRNTRGFQFAVDRAVTHAGHGEHGGYFTSQHGQVTCACGEPVYEITPVPPGGDAA